MKIEIISEVNLHNPITAKFVLIQKEENEYVMCIFNRRKNHDDIAVEQIGKLKATEDQFVGAGIVSVVAAKPPEFKWGSMTCARRFKRIQPKDDNLCDDLIEEMILAIEDIKNLVP